MAISYYCVSIIEYDKPERTIKLFPADNIGSRKRAITCAKVWACYGKAGIVVNVVRYNNGIPAENVKRYKKVVDKIIKS